MKRIFILLLIPFSTLTAVAQTKKHVVPKKAIVTRKKAVAKTVAPASTAKNTLDSASYAFGTAMAGSLKGKGLNTLNYTLMLKGMKDLFNGNKLMISEQASQTSINNLFEQTNKAKFAGNITEGKTFLENNKQITGVKTTPSGLQYMVIKEGSNEIRPQSTDTVLVNYKGTLLNGKQFDSSYDRNEPLSLPLNKVIQGWTEGMQLMSQGAKYRFFIPYNLAYGERGAGQDIPPYSTLIFEIELLKINGK